MIILWIAERTLQCALSRWCTFTKTNSCFR